MTAMSACRIELEALRERISHLIHELKVAERITDAFDGPEPVIVPGMRAERVNPVVPTPSKGNGKPVVSTTPPELTDASQTAILQALRKADEPLSGADLVARTKQSMYCLKPHLDALIRLGGVVKIGKTLSTRYALSPKLRSGPAAGTPSGPAGGSGPDHRSAAPGGFEVAWNGTKERNGEAPSILPPRERKA